MVGGALLETCSDAHRSEEAQLRAMINNCRATLRHSHLVLVPVVAPSEMAVADASAAAPQPAADDDTDGK